MARYVARATCCTGKWRAQWLRKESPLRAVRDAAASMAERKTSSWVASAARTPSASASHRRVEPSTSVNRNVTTPEGGPPADTRTGCHTKPTSTQQTATDFRDSRKSSVSRHELVSGGVPSVSGRLPGSEVLTASLARPSAAPVRIARRQRRFCRGCPPAGNAPH